MTIKLFWQITASLLLSGLLVNAQARESITIYQTHAVQVSGLQRINPDALDVEIIELDKLERLEEALSDQVNLSPGMDDETATARIRKQMNAITLKAIGTAWREIIEAEQRGVDPMRLPAVFYHGTVHHDVQDIRSVLQTKP